LGEALADAGKTQEAGYCFRRAIALAPLSPQIELRAANFYFRIGSIGEGLALESRILNQTSDFDEMMFRSSMRMTDAKSVLAAGIGSNARAVRAFFDFLIRNGSRSDLEETWHWMDSRGFAAPKQSREWADWLLTAKHPGEAASVWATHLALNPAEYEKSNWIDNGGFEQDWSGQAFEWTSLPCPGVSIAADSKAGHTGGRALRLEVDAVDNLDFHHFFQRSWLKPGRYRLEGWVRTREFTTDQGIGLRAVASVEGREPAIDAFTPPVSGTQEWTRIAQDFTVGTPGRLVEVQIVRKPSWAFDNQPRGTAWVDDVRVVPLP
jgi:hypothetical protein